MLAVQAPLKVLMVPALLEVRVPLMPLEVLLTAPALLNVCRLGGTSDAVSTADAMETGLRGGVGWG